MFGSIWITEEFYAKDGSLFNISSGVIICTFWVTTMFSAVLAKGMRFEILLIFSVSMTGTFYFGWVTESTNVRKAKITKLKSLEAHTIHSSTHFHFTKI